ncbi:MAG: LCP family protein [Galactobacter sp.]|mgnify:CR=1 FL=1|uniref:LCP family protein n=1 Tax=Galactobacter sp. TaxID=2676125 RepID=UPI0025BCBA3B|nr:LCP family protein [Galactobacter sp.]
MGKDRDEDVFGLRPPPDTQELPVVQARSERPAYEQQPQPQSVPETYAAQPQTPQNNGGGAGGYPGGPGQPGQPEQPPRRPKKRHPVRKFFVTLLIILLVLLAAGAGYGWWLLHKFDSQSQTIENALPDYEGRPAGGPGTNILLLGSDTRAESGSAGEAAAASGRTDTMMFVHVPKGGGNVTVTSIMRDTWVPIPGHGEAKINAAFAYGGVPLAAQTVEQLLDTRIDHVATIDFSGFKGLVDALGGVKVDVPVPFEKDGTKFEGSMTLNGDQALTFARERKSFKTGDYQRVQDQQILIKAIMSKAATPSTLANPVKLNNVVDDFSPYIGVDEDFSGTEIAKLGWGLRGGGDSVKMFTLPNLGTGWAGGQSIVQPDMDAISDFSEALKKDDMDAFVKDHKLD